MGEVLQAINAELCAQLTLVPPKEWIEKVRELAEPFLDSARLRDLAQERKEIVGPYEVCGHPLFETTKAKRVSPTLAGLKPLGQHDVSAWVRAWREDGNL